MERLMTKYVRAHDGVEVKIDDDGDVMIKGNGLMSWAALQAMLDEGYIVKKKVTAQDFRIAFCHSPRCSGDDIEVLAQVLIDNNLGHVGLAALKNEN
jgi:hypothetical protein